jgi:ATP-dependent exoDNAse (exonuclease V) beta subunit
MLHLAADTALRLPSVTVLKASAGSGKTYTLTARYVQFLLSRTLPRNELSNILAITFANNASREMRQEVLRWLKKLNARDATGLADIGAVLGGGEERAARGAGPLIELILSRFSEFQVKTIDSFMSMVFRASALDFGYSPEFEIVLEQDALLDYAFTLFLRDATEGSERAALLDRTVRAVLEFKGTEAAFPWDPSSSLREEMRELASRLSAVNEHPVVEDLHAVLRSRESEARAAIEQVSELVEASGLERNTRSTFPRLLASVRAGRFGDLLTAGSTPPVKKPSPKDDAAYQAISDAWASVDRAIGAYAGCWARAWYGSLLHLYEGFSESLEKVKRAQGQVFIGDIGRALADALRMDIVPDIYFRLGERIWHFLVDEFQDTSPLQWRTLFPLIENSLAAGGSLFVVGDTKQAIYGFRQADYRIMRALEEGSPFASAGRTLDELTENHRSRPRVLDLAAAVFRSRAAESTRYAEAARRSGLDSWRQDPTPGPDPGYAEVRILERDEELSPEKDQLLDIVTELSRRGYRWGDVAILASRNDDIVRATSWLNERGIPFLSFSSLDVRTRGVAEEMLALLAFLDSPPDDLSFATFILGRIFGHAVHGRTGWTDAGPLRELLFQSRTDRPLYKAFQEKFPALWKECFAGLFRAAGYLPLYDLVSESYARFSVFSCVPQEEATLAKLLEAVKDFEGTGGGSLREFLAQADSEGGKWAIEVPHGVNSVQAMTVHKAKGLGFPVVIALLYGGRARSAGAGLLPDEDGTLRLVRVTAALAEHDASIQALREEEELRQSVDRMNALYVALTRARRELYVIGVRGEGDSFPFDLLPEEGFSPQADKGDAVPSQEAGEPPTPLSHDARPVKVSFESGRLSRAERRRGELAHRMLALAGAAPADLEETLTSAGARAAQEAREDLSATAALVPALLRLVRGTELAGFFTAAEGRSVLIEQDFCDAAGRLFRMDRVILDPGRVVVIDYKTGAEEPAAHELQLRGYMEILSGAYPGRPVTGVAAYVDLGTARSVE